MFQQEAAKLILAILDTQSVAVMDKNGDLTECFTGKHAEMCLRHAGLDAQFEVPHGQIGIPCPAPADTDIQALVLRQIQAEIGQPRGGTASLVRVHADMILGITRI